METSRSRIRAGDRVRIGVAGVVTVAVILVLIVSHRGGDPGGSAAGSSQPSATATTDSPATATAPDDAAPTSAPSRTPEARTDKCPATILACVDLEQRQTWLQADGRIIYGPVPMEPGTGEAATPTGTFAVSWKDEEHISGEYGDAMPFSVFFAPGGIAFHQGSLTAPSHGCVHLRHTDAAHYFHALQPGDPVAVF